MRRMIGEKKREIVIAEVLYDAVTGETNIVINDDWEELPTFLLPDVIGDMKFDLNQLSQRVDDMVEERRQEILARSN